MKLFKNLSAGQKKALLKLPAYISLLASTDLKMDEAEKMSAIKLAHTRSFSCEPLLADFYREADRNFEKNIVQLNKELPMEMGIREAEVQKEIRNLEKIVLKLGDDYTLAMQRSLKTFKEHVAKAHHSVIEDFILPITIPGLTD